MNNAQKKYELSRNTANVQLGHRLSRGMTAFGRSATKLVTMLASWLSVYALWLVAFNRIDFSNPLVAPAKLSMFILLVLLLAAVPVTLFWFWGGPVKAGNFQRNLIRAGLVNVAGEGPTLIDLSSDPQNSNIKKCPDLDTYNTLNPGKVFSQILVVCDELAEVTDTTGADKTTKEQITAIIGSLGTLARLGRAFGIHLLMSTQRPDANILPGQVKNNADVRVCGRADLVLSQIIMDNGDAADLPKDIPGRFLVNQNSGTVFQGYIHDDLEEQGGVSGWLRSMAIPPLTGWQSPGRCTRGNCRRSDGLRP